MAYPPAWIKAYAQVLGTCGMLHIRFAGIENVRQWLGHKSMNSTGAYLQVDDEQASQAILRAESDVNEASEISREQVDSLGGVGVEEALRRVIRQLEQAKSKKSRQKG